MEFYENVISNEFESCPCDGYCDDSPSGPTGCDDDNEGWHSND